MTDVAAEAAASHPRLVVRAVLRTDVGLVRAENQDFGTYTTVEEEQDCHPGGRLLVVADGMGGHRGGATASRLAGETVKAQYLGCETRDIPTALRESLARANARIFSEAQSNPELRGMGTTTSALAVRGNDAWYAHVGDSRIYLVRDGQIRQLTDDHSLVASMVREGLLTLKEAETHPRRNVLQRSMGVAEDVEIDVRGPFELRDGDVFILCSDGLHGVVKEEEIADIAKLPLDEAADEYLRRALDRGAPDNVTVIVARVEPATDDDPLFEERFDDTQPVEPIDRSLFDETVRDATMAQEDVDTNPVPAVKEPTPAPAPATPEPVSETADTAPQPILRADDAPKANPVLKWTLLVALVLGAAGAWLYWNWHEGLTAPAHTSTR
jgi:serine/threonine protein phosphatase PrpC